MKKRTSWRARIPHKRKPATSTQWLQGSKGEAFPLWKIREFRCPQVPSPCIWRRIFFIFYSILHSKIFDFSSAYALSKYEKRVPRQKVKENRSLNRLSTILPSYLMRRKVSPTSYLSHTAQSMRKFDPVDSAENWTVFDDPAINWTVMIWLGRKLGRLGPKISGFRMTEVGRYPVTLLISLWYSKIQN